MEQKLSLKECSVKDKKVLVRVDFNVPLDKEGHVTDDSRIVSSLPTICYILDHGGAAILMSHLGRPKGCKTASLSLKPCAEKLSQLLNREVMMAPDCIGKETEQLARDLKPGQILLLENLRFHDSEEHPEKDPSFAKQLAALGDLYVNDAFGTAHRKHSSTATITQYFPNQSAAGFLMEKEIEFLGTALLHAKRPFQAIIGGAKVSSKIGVLKALLDKVDALLIGGGMAYTFFKAQNYKIGDSIHEDAHLQDALFVLEQAKLKGVKLLLPLDNVVVMPDSTVRIFDAQAGIPDGAKGVDIGPKTIEAFLHCLKDAKTILWNGPLGVFEDPKFAKGTLEIAKALPDFSATTVVGGGDSVAAIHMAGVADKMTHLSTGGGASLEYIEFGTLPGIDALSNT